MAHIQKTITYDMPDVYEGNTKAEGKTSTMPYDGPEQLILWVDNESVVKALEIIRLKRETAIMIYIRLNIPMEISIRYNKINIEIIERITPSTIAENIK